jgi:hypothetical protein
LYEEVNMANNAQAFKSGNHPGYEETAWEGLKQTIDVIAEKGIKVVINGGALNPKGLALRVDELVRSMALRRTSDAEPYRPARKGLLCESLTWKEMICTQSSVLTCPDLQMN